MAEKELERRIAQLEDIQNTAVSKIVQIGSDQRAARKPKTAVMQ